MDVAKKQKSVIGSLLPQPSYWLGVAQNDMIPLSTMYDPCFDFPAPEKDDRNLFKYFVSRFLARSNPTFFIFQDHWKLLQG